MAPLFLTAGPIEVALIAAIVMLLFGPKLVPWVSKRLGQSTAWIEQSQAAFRDGRDE